MSAITVRRASADDVPAASAVMTASITQLCGLDHDGDPEIIAGWTRNKTPELVARMLANPDLSMFVAEVEGSVGAVGAIGGTDTIALNYVAPAHRFHGLSRALLTRMEAEMAALGTEIGRLTSTRTALRFYRSCGWQDDGPPEGGHSVEGHPMTKRLARPGKATGSASSLS